MSKISLAALSALALAGSAFAIPAQAQYRQHVTNDLARCAASGPAVRVSVNGIESSTGRIRIQSYRATAADWLQKGRWVSRIELPARSGTMVFCLPLPEAGSYAVAVRHDVNGNGKTDLTSDGGGMSNNPGINIFNLGKPSISRTAFTVGNEARSISITMRYM